MMLPCEKGYDRGMAAISFAMRAATAVAGAKGASGGAAAAGGAAKEAGASSSQVLGLVQSVMGLADESKNLIKDVIGKPFADSAKKLEMGRSVVQNDANGLIQQIDMLPDGVKRFSQALKDLTNAVTDRGREISGFSGPLSQSFAETDVKRMMADVREANYLGQSYSRVNNASAEFDTKFMDAMNPVKDALANVLAEILERLTKVLDIMNDNIDVIVIMSEAAVATFQFISGNWQGAMETIDRVPEKIIKAQQSKEMSNEFVQGIFTNSAKADKNMVPRDQVGNAHAIGEFK